MNATVLLVTIETNTTAGYVIGAVISICILGYLLYSLVKPDKF
jgi:K+-transporting ATPase KdpF subunit